MRLRFEVVPDILTEWIIKGLEGWQESMDVLTLLDIDYPTRIQVMQKAGSAQYTKVRFVSGRDFTISVIEVETEPRDTDADSE